MTFRRPFFTKMETGYTGKMLHKWINASDKNKVYAPDIARNEVYIIPSEHAVSEFDTVYKQLCV